MRDSTSIAKVLKADTCSGCGACEALAPGAVSMKLNDAGFLRPAQSASVDASTDLQIAKVCPGMTLQQRNKEGDNHVLWGPITGLRTGYSTDAKLRHHASSGGGLSALLMHLLNSRQVQHVIHVTADGESPLDNAVVVSNSPAGVYDGAGSRYAPSAPLARMNDYLALPGQIALVGKPCDIAAARAMARLDPRIDKKVNFMLSFFCAGVPSRKGTQRVIEKLDVAESDVTSFRYRGDGWPGYAAATTKDGETRRMSYMDSWGRILSHHVQFRCKICPDGSGMEADVVCADAWECDEAGYPKFDERDGESLIVSRTAKGENLVREAITQGQIVARDFNASQVADMQPGQYRRRRVVLSRILAMRVLLRRLPKYEGFRMFEAARFAGPVEHLRTLFGMIRRLVLP